MFLHCFLPCVYMVTLYSLILRNRWLGGEDCAACLPVSGIKHDTLPQHTSWPSTNALVAQNPSVLLPPCSETFSVITVQTTGFPKPPSPSQPLSWAPLPTLGGSGVRVPVLQPRYQICISYSDVTFGNGFLLLVSPSIGGRLKTVPVTTCLKALGAMPARVCCGDKAFAGSLSLHLCLFSLSDILSIWSVLINSSWIVQQL